MTDLSAERTQQLAPKITAAAAEWAGPRFDATFWHGFGGWLLDQIASDLAAREQAAARKALLDAAAWTEQYPWFGRGQWLRARADTFHPDRRHEP